MRSDDGMITMLVPLHGIASRSDLPLPFPYVVVGAAITLAVSFLVMLLAWRKPLLSRPRPHEIRWLTRTWSHAWVRWLLRLLVLALYLLVAAAVFFGKDLLTNPAFWFVFSVVWVGLVPTSLLLGPIWRELSPLRTLYDLITAAARLDGAGFVRLPRWVGVWPAAIGLFGFAFLELVQPDRATLPVLRVWVLAWFCTAILGAVIFGRRWFSAAEPFEAYATHVSKLSWLGFDAELPGARTGTSSKRRSPRRSPRPTRRPGGPGRLYAQNPLRMLGGWSAPRGSAAVVCALLGSTAFDSFQNTSWWVRSVAAAGIHPTLFAAAGLLTMIAIVLAAFTIACWAMRPFVTGVPFTDLPRRMAPSVVPIVIGYAFAHYFTAFVAQSQTFFITISDPFGLGWNLFGTATLGAYTGLYNVPTAIAVLQVCFILGGHVLGIVIAHERSLVVLQGSTRPHATITGQLPMLVLMVFFTCSGLLLLFRP